MEVELIIKSVMGLIVILALLIFFLFFTPKKATSIKKPPPKSKPDETTIGVKSSLDSLVKIIKNKTSTADELSEALELVIKDHGNVHPKMGLRAHPDFNIYANILFTICRHKNANKDLIIKFDKELEQLNPEYKQEINEAMTKGLNSRRV